MKYALLLTGLAATMWAGQHSDKKPVQAQSTSSMSYSVKDGAPTIDITNVAYEVTNSLIPGLGHDDQLVLRKTVHTKEVIGDIGIEGSTTVQAWTLGVDLKQKPLYSLTVQGIEPRTVNSDLLVISRGLEEVQWWSAYKLGSGAHMFDTYVPLVQVSISKDIQELRYMGLEVPEDDAADARLKAPNVVSVLTYASGDHVIREALITCANKDQAALLRSFADSTRKMTATARSITLTISQQTGGRAPSTITIPIVKDDLDFAHAVAPAGVHVAAWKR